MKLFLDSSVLLAACGRTTGASYYVLSIAAMQSWELLSSPYVRAEVEANIYKLGPEA